MEKTPGSGRKAGTPNKKTLVLKEIFDDLKFDVPKKLVILMKKLNDEKQAEVLLELMSYLFPKRKAIEHSGPDGDPLPGHSLTDQRFQELKQQLVELINK